MGCDGKYSQDNRVSWCIVDRKRTNVYVTFARDCRLRITGLAEGENKDPDPVSHARACRGRAASCAGELPLQKASLAVSIAHK